MPQRTHLSLKLRSCGAYAIFPKRRRPSLIPRSTPGLSRWAFGARSTSVPPAFGRSAEANEEQKTQKELRNEQKVERKKQEFEKGKAPAAEASATPVASVTPSASRSVGVAARVSPATNKKRRSINARVRVRDQPKQQQAFRLRRRQRRNDFKQSQCVASLVRARTRAYRWRRHFCRAGSL